MEGLFRKVFGELKKNDLPFYCLLFILAAAVCGGFSFNIPLQIICLFISLACFSFLFIGKSFENKGVYLVLLPLAAVFISYIGADFQTNARTSSLFFFNAVLAFFIASYSGGRGRENILITILILSIWISFLVFVQTFAPALDRQKYAFLNPDAAAGFLTLAYPLCFPFIEKNRYPLVFLSLAFLIFVALTAAQSAAAAIIAYAVTVFYFSKLRKSARFKAFFFTVSLFILAGFIYAVMAKTGFKNFEDWVIWQKAAALMFKDNPVTGAGFGNFGAMLAYYRPDYSLNTLFSHNIVSQLLSETGFLGILSFFIAGFVFFKNAVSFRRHGVDISCVISAAAFIALNVVGFGFFIPANAIAFFIICAFAFKTQTRPRNDKRAASLIFIPAAFLIFVFSKVLIADAYFNRADALSNLGNFAEAKEKYLKALKYDGKNADYWKRFSENEILAKNYPDAAIYMLNAEKYYRRSSQIKAESAYLYKISGDDENAAKYANLAREYDKFNPFYLKPGRKSDARQN
jgi:O-antigen ligase